MPRAGRALRRHRVKVSITLLATSLATLLLLLATGVLGGTGSREAAHRLRTTLQAQGADDRRSLGVLELVEFLALEDTAGDRSARRKRISALVGQARDLQLRGEYEGLVGLMGNLDALTVLGDEADLDRMLPAEIRSVKVGLVRQLRAELSKPGLGAEDRRGHLSTLEGLLLDRDVLVVKNAAVALGAAADRSSLGGLMDALHRQQDPRARRVIIEALSAYAGPEVTDVLSGELRHPDPWVRHTALGALGRLTPADLAERIEFLSSDPEPWIVSRWREVQREVGGKGP